MSELRLLMVRDITLRGFSPRTHKSSIAAVVRLARYYRRSLAELTDEEVQAYLLHLVQHRKQGGIHTLRHNAGSRIMPGGWPDAGSRVGSRHRIPA